MVILFCFLSNLLLILRAKSELTGKKTMSWIIGSFFLIFTQICWVVADHNTSDLAADWKGNLTSEDFMNFTATDILGIKVKANWFRDEASSSNAFLNETVIKTMTFSKEVKVSEESLPSLLHPKFDDKDESQERQARETSLNVTHLRDEVTSYSPVLNNGHLEGSEEDNSMIMNPGVTTENNRAHVTTSYPNNRNMHFSEDNLYPEYYPTWSNVNVDDYSTSTTFQACFATSSHLYLEESELPTCERTEMEEERVECDLPELTCRNRCQEDLHELSMKNSSGIPCHCSTRCLLYNICCEDFEEQCPGTYAGGNEQLELFEGKQAVCSKHIRAMLIAHCPRDMPDEQLRNQCENPDLSQITQLFPVTDSVSGHHFQNIYCWKCWSMTGDALSWEAVISFNDQNAHENEYDREPMVSILVNEIWRVQWVPKPHLPAFFCESCAMNRCTGCRHTDETKAKRCSTLNSYVQINGITYANKYCYTCSQEYEFMYFNLFQCNVPSIPNQERYGNDQSRHVFEFNVVASVIEKVMRVEVKTDKSSPYSSFLWSSMNCAEDASACEVNDCLPGVQPDSNRCAPPVATVERTMQIKLTLSSNITLTPDLSLSPKLSSSGKEVLDTVKRLCEEGIEQEFQSSKIAVKNWVTEVPNLDLFLQFQCTVDVYTSVQYDKFKNLLLVKAMEALYIHDVPGMIYICVGDFEVGLPLPIQLHPSDCLPYVNHLGSRASGLFPVPKYLMWTSVFLYLASF